MPAQQNPITVHDFQMRFGNTTVIEDLSFEVRPGETFGFLGSNGSGKTTTIRALLGIYEPTRGKLLINGHRYSPERSQQLGYLPEERGLYQKETVIDCMTYFGRLKGMVPTEARKWIMEYLDQVELGEKADVRIDHLSGGQQQKIQLGVTIMNNPKLLILDEPTKGFDPVNRRLLMNIIEGLTKEGTATVLVTHQMEEAERLCDRVLLLKDGTRRLYGTVDEVRGKFGSSQIGLRFDGKLPDRSMLYTITARSGQTAKLSMKKGATPKQIFSALAAAPSLSVTKFEVEQASLDDIFVQIYREAEVPTHA